MFLRKEIDGNWYVCRNYGRNTGGKWGKKPVRSWFFLKSNSAGTQSSFPVKNIYFPKEFIGKKIKIKVEIIDEK